MYYYNGFSMAPSRFNHFLRVAQNMNNYVLASARQQYRGHSDRAYYSSMYPRPAMMHHHHNQGWGSLVAYGLEKIGMSTGMVRAGSHLARWMDLYG